MKHVLKNVRLSFPSLFRKAVFNGDETKYEATFLLDKDAHAAIIEAIEKDTNQRIKSELKGAKVPADRRCLKDGDESSYDGYDGCMSLKASNNKRPLVIDRDKSPLTEDDERMYAGCYVNAQVELWVQNNNYGKRINANLLGVQFFKDGEPFADGAKTSSVDDFDAFDDEDDDLDF